MGKARRVVRVQPLLSFLLLLKVEYSINNFMWAQTERNFRLFVSVCFSFFYFLYLTHLIIRDLDWWNKVKKPKTKAWNGELAVTKAGLLFNKRKKKKKVSLMCNSRADNCFSQTTKHNLLHQALFRLWAPDADVAFRLRITQQVQAHGRVAPQNHLPRWHFFSLTSQEKHKFKNFYEWGSESGKKKTFCPTRWYFMQSMEGNNLFIQPNLLKLQVTFKASQIGSFIPE